MGLFDGTALERPVLCQQCGLDVKVCDCQPVVAETSEPEVAPEQQRLKVRTEKRKRAKVVTVITGIQGSSRQLQQLFTTLKNHCGAGGTTAENTIEIQGDHLDRILSQLRELGYRC